MGIPMRCRRHDFFAAAFPCRPPAGITHPRPRPGCAATGRQHGGVAATPPTLGEIARAAGVSVATVSKALSPHADRCDIAAATRARLRALAISLGWTGEPPRRSRPRRRYGNVGLLFGNRYPPASGAYERLYEGAAQALDRAGIRLLFIPAYDRAEWERVRAAQHLDGALVVGHLPAAVLAELVETRYPAVLVNLPSPLPLDQVLCDDAAGARLLAAHLAAQGCRCLVFLCDQPPESHASVAERRTGLAAAAAQLGLAFDDLPSAGLAQALAAHPPAAGHRIAVVCYHQALLPPVLRTIRRRRDAGDDPAGLLLACWNGSPWFPFLDPPVTAVEVPMAAMAERAIALLLARLDGAAGDPVREVLAQRIVVPEA